MKETIVVIGANYGRTAVLNTTLDQLLGNRTMAFDRNPDTNFLGCGMALWIGGQVSGPEGLFYSSKEASEKKGIVIHIEIEIERTDFDGKVAYAGGEDGKSYVQEYDKLILATGSVPPHPKIEGMEPGNVQFVKLCQSTRDVTKKLRNTSVKRMAAVGVGYIGVELAEAFKKNGREIVLIDLADTCLSGYYDKEFSDKMVHNLQKHGVKPALGEKAVRLEGKRRVERMMTDQGCYEADMIVFGIGFRPDTFLGQGGLRTFGNRASLVGRRQETGVSGVYAVRDCATVYNSAIQATDYIALATNVVRSRITVAHNACGKVLESIDVRGSSGISIWGLHTLSMGISLARAKWMGYDATTADYESQQKAELMENGNHKVRIRIVYDRKSKIILGAQMCSDYDVSMSIHIPFMAVEGQVTIDKLKLFDLFFLLHLSKPYNYATMVTLGTGQD